MSRTWDLSFLVVEHLDPLPETSIVGTLYDNIISCGKVKMDRKLVTYLSYIIAFVKRLTVKSSMRFNYTWKIDYCEIVLLITIHEFTRSLVFVCEYKKAGLANDFSQQKYTSGKLLIGNYCMYLCRMIGLRLYCRGEAFFALSSLTPRVSAKWTVPPAEEHLMIHQTLNSKSALTLWCLERHYKSIMVIWRGC